MNLLNDQNRKSLFKTFQTIEGREMNSDHRTNQFQPFLIFYFPLPPFSSCLGSFAQENRR